MHKNGTIEVMAPPQSPHKRREIHWNTKSFICKFMVHDVSFFLAVRFPAPTAVNVTSITWNTAVLKWRPIKRTEDIVYRVAYYRESNMKQIINKETFTAHLKLEGLEQLRGYFVTVQSGNGELFGAESTKKTFFITLGMSSF